MASPSKAQETVLFCIERHTVGLQLSEGGWKPGYQNQHHGRRYAIRFNSDQSRMSGVQGSDTVYKCGNYFPNRAPDVITCINSKVGTMVFNYSTESERFLLSLVGPGGWLGEGTEREKGREPFFDHMIMGTCQEF